MNHRSGGPRSFNTVKRSNREERQRRRGQCAKTLLGIFIVSFLLVLSVITLLVCNLAVGIYNRRQAQSGEGDPNLSTPNLPGITYQMSTQKNDLVYAGELAVVNGSHEYLFPQRDADQLKDLSSYRKLVDGKEPYQIKNGTTARLQATAAAKLNALLTEYYGQTDTTLVVFDTYRTKAEQESYSVRPGFSEHHTGLLVSLSQSHGGYTLDLTAHARLFEICHRYGFIQRYPDAKSKLTGVSGYGECLRYVGVAHATYIAQNNLCLEEYVELLRKNHVSATGTDGKHLLVDTDGDGTANYAVYYVPKSTTGDLTAVPIPNGIEYTVSGDNIGGFIVTVTLNP